VRVDEQVHIYGNVVVEDVEAVLASSSAVGSANANAYDKWQAALPPEGRCNLFSSYTKEAALPTKSVKFQTQTRMQFSRYMIFIFMLVDTPRFLFHAVCKL
jgi:hypothetical protein